MAAARPWGPTIAKGNSPEMGSSSTYTGGVNCHSGKNGRPKQDFVGWMMYNRYWFKKDLYAVTLGGGPDEQSRPLSDSAATYQRSERDIRYTVLH